MVTEADWQAWTSADLQPYMKTVWDLFGQQRIMFGSDWPVCLVAAEYQQVKQLVVDFVSEQSPQASKLIMGENAQRFYQL